MNPARVVPAPSHHWAALALAVMASSSVAAQDTRYRDGRFLEMAGGVTIQRSDEASSDEAVRNMPFLPGDRVWTDQAGRAEIVFADGEILWIAERSKVDSLGRGGRDQDERLGLRVFAGSFGARVRDGGPGFEFRAPGGSVTTTGASAFRVDVRSGETVVSVSEGAVLADLGGQRLSIRAGDRVIYADGRVDGPIGYQRGRMDAFDRWIEEREAALEELARDRDHERLPDELDPYGEELDENGDWVYDEPSGYVYVPRVAHDWAPYTYGRWVYTLYGWTWVADEPWGFVTSHYGRWGYSSRIGWHWMPKVGFSGAWVGWSSPVGRWSHTIGWCALGFNDRPVGAYSAYGSGGRAIVRGGSRSVSSGSGWSFADRSDMGRASIHRRRVSLPAEEAERAVAWKPEAAPDRTFGETRRSLSRGSGLATGLAQASGAVRRGEGSNGSDTAPRINVRPSPGDSTPELRSDPTTTIPSPESRRRRGFGQDGFKEEQDNRRNRRLSSESETPPDQGAPAAQGESAREQPQRDPLLNRFFRSITRSDSSNRDTGATGSSREESTGLRRREPTARDDSSTRDNTATRDDNTRERSRPAERTSPDRSVPERRSPPPRTMDQDTPRSRPTGGDRAQPRAAPAPRPQGGGSSSDDRGASRRPRPGL